MLTRELNVPGDPDKASGLNASDVSEFSPLRFHHLLCLPLFKGKGYSDGFSVNMQAVKDRLEGSGEVVRLVCESDMICANCPNRTQDGCELDGQGKRVADKDRLVGELSGIGMDNASSGISYYRALEMLKSNMKKCDFDRLCGECRWNKLGLCGYDEWLESVELVLKSGSQIET